MREINAATMSAIPAGDAVRGAIAQASRRTGVDFRYLLAQARIESSLDPDARAPTSSAAGLYQFTKGTWLRTLDRHAEAHGLGWAADAIAGGRVTDPAMTSQIMALRYNPEASALMAAELARDNGAELSAQLGREPDAAELYLAHFLGSGGASKFLTALGQTPGASAAGLMPQAAAANRTIFYERSGAPRSVAGVMDLIRGKVENAMSDIPGHWAQASPSAPPDAASAFAQSAPVREFAAARAQFAAPARASMAAVLEQTFGALSPGGTMPGHVRAAYGTLRRFAL